MKVDPVVPDRGLECCCEVDVRFLLYSQPGLTGTPSAMIQIPVGAIAAGAGIMFGEIICCGTSESSTLLYSSRCMGSVKQLSPSILAQTLRPQIS